MRKLLHSAGTALLLLTILCLPVMAENGSASSVELSASSASVQSVEALGELGQLESNLTASQGMNLLYQAHVAYEGWMPAVNANTETGSTNGANQIEALALSIPASEGGIEYRTHLADTGWQDWVGNAQISGTVGEGKAVQAVEIKLTGQAEQNYDVYYRIMSKSMGWLGWTENGTTAGTTGLNVPATAVQVVCVPKGDPAPGEMTLSSLTNSDVSTALNLSYSTHVKNIGWTDNVPAGSTAGTVGKALQMEALTIDDGNITEVSADSGISYQTHSAGLGWTGWKISGDTSGTTGQNIELQAIQIKLTGKAADLFDVYYRVHVKDFGWMDWAKNGETAGTTGLFRRMEAIEIKYVQKGGAAPGAVTQPVLTSEDVAAKSNVVYQTQVQNIGWQNPVYNGNEAGTTGQGLAVEALKISLPDYPNSQIIYNTYVQDLEWQGEVANGSTGGTVGQNKHIEAISVRLDGEVSRWYKVYYQTYVENKGWMDWAVNGGWAGTTEGNLQIEAVRVKLVLKGDSTPGATATPYEKIEPPAPVQTWLWPLDGIYSISSHFGWRDGSMHEGTDIPAPSGTPIKAVRSGTVVSSGWLGGYGYCVVIRNDSGESVYYAHQSKLGVNAGQVVSQGDVIGYVGSTGWSTGNHLHLGVLVGNDFVDPMTYYPNI